MPYELVIRHDTARAAPLTPPHALVVSFVVLLIAVAAAAQAPAHRRDHGRHDRACRRPTSARRRNRPVELNLINLPTTMSLKRHQSYFRLTHRFARDLRRGDFGQLAEDFFSLDNGAIIGLEYRFGITSNLQAGVHRIDPQQDDPVLRPLRCAWQGSGTRRSASRITGSVEGLDNFHQNYQPGIAVTVSRGGQLARTLRDAGFVAHTRAADTLAGHEGHDHGDLASETSTSTTATTARPSSASAPASASGRRRSSPASTRRGWRATTRARQWGVAIEKQTAGHTLQLNFTNSFGTTLGEIARGGSPHDVYLGFNLTRRF